MTTTPVVDPLFAERYRLAGGETGYLGRPIAASEPVVDGRMQRFERGNIYWSPRTAAFSVHGGIGVFYEAAGGPAGYLGFPKSTELGVADGVVQHFERGSVYWSPRTEAFSVHGGIGVRYALANGPAGYLGFPKSTEVGVADGVVQHFERGSVYWSPRTEAFSVHGGIGVRYGLANGPAGYLGFPKSTEVGVGDGVVQHFERGDIFWSPKTAAFSVHGGIGVAFAAAGGAAGALGFPTGPEQASADKVVQTFQNGSITWTMATGAQVSMATRPVTLTRVDTFINGIAPMAQENQRLYGVPASVTIAQAILESGWGESELSRYGQAFFGVKCHSTSYSPYATGCVPLPTWEVYNGVSVIEWAYFRSYDSLADSVLDHGYFLRNNSRYAAAFNTTDPVKFATEIKNAGYATDPDYVSKLVNLIDYNELRRFDVGVKAGEVPVAGAIGAHYLALGGPAGKLGTAIGIEANGPVTGGRMVSFNAGMITWSGETGPRALVGSVWDTYRLDPGLRPLLGLPTTGAFAVGTTTAQVFQRGAVYVTPAETYSVFGGIYVGYRAAGGHEVLGVPTSSEQVVGSAVVQRFERGSITWTAETGAVVNPG